MAASVVIDSASFYTQELGVGRWDSKPLARVDRGQIISVFRPEMLRDRPVHQMVFLYANPTGCGACEVHAIQRDTGTVIHTIMSYPMIVWVWIEES